jgi:enolase
MIKNIVLSEIYNSCEEKTIKISIRNEDGVYSAISPSGTSKGSYEAATLDLEEVKRIFPKIKKNLLGKREDEADIIMEKIGIEKIGANLSTAISMAVARALTKNNPYKLLKKEPEFFPFPLGNVIGGGMHGGYLSEQELLVIPVKAKTVEEAMKTNLSIWKEIGKSIEPFVLGKNRENAWMCSLNDLKAIEILTDVAKNFGAGVGIDFAANSLYNDRYYYKHPDRNFSAEDQLDFILDLIKTYKLVYVEDPFEENDFENLAELTKKAKCLVVGDDYFATQKSRLEHGINRKAGNAIIIKPNQVGTIRGTLETVKTAKMASYTPIISHRSCETEDSFIADLAVAVEAPIIKCGVFGKEREAKLKRLVDIWDETKKPKMANISHLI